MTDRGPVDPRQSQGALINDRRFDRDYPDNQDGFHNPPPTDDRFPRRNVVYSVPPPRNNAGADGLGAPPRRDRRRSRSQGANVCAAINMAFMEAKPTLTAQLATYDTGPDEGGEESTTLMLLLKTYDFSENAVTGLGGGDHADPFAGVVTHQLQTPLSVLQSLEVIVNLQWGHDGVSQKVVANVPAGQIVKGGLSGSYVRTHARVTARYYKRFQGTNAGAVEVFFYLDPDANTRNNIFNSIDSPALVASLGYDRDTVPITPIHIEGIIGQGVAAISQGGSFDRSSRITRRFFGTFPNITPYANGAGGAFILCPIAFGASAIMLQALPTPFTDPAGRLFSNLLMGQMDHSGNILIAELPPNVFFPIYPETAAVFVYNPAVNSAENPFSLIYDLGL